MIKIISHRGMWKTNCEKNSLNSLKDALDKGFGIETDVRDFKGKIVISHDMATEDSPSLVNLLEIFQKCKGILALNIKSDGIAANIGDLLSSIDQSRIFAFDMSIPEMKKYIDLSVPIYGRLSEVETCASWYSHWSGIWLDAFEHIWYDKEKLKDIVCSGKKVCLVSRELHGFDSHNQWKLLYEFRGADNVMLCTDFPEKAAKFFGVKND